MKEQLRSPRFIVPMAALGVEQLPEGDVWLYELKLDGYRAVLIKDGGRVQILSRKHTDLTRDYPSIAASGRRLAPSRVTLDGEIVALDERGRPSFQSLQNRARRPHTVFFAFDVLHLEGRDLTMRTLEERRRVLPDIVSGSGLLISQDLPGTAAEVIDAVRALGLEGVVAKRRDSVYEPGKRSGAWVKFKTERQQEFVVGGYRPASNAVDALVVGYYVGKKLHFAAKVRAGFVAHTRREVFEKLRPLETKVCPFANLPNEKSSRWGGGITEEEMMQYRWVKPDLVAQIRFHEWTDDGRLRSSAFVGLRSDKIAKDVRREST